MHKPRTPGSLDRRRFLQTSLLGASALALDTCITGGRNRIASAATTEAAASRHRLPERPAPPEKSRVAVVRSDGHPGHREAIQQAIELAGGLGFIRPGETVLLKPAANSSSRYPATTDPETIWVVAEMVKAAGGEPFVGDRTMFLHSTRTVFEETGIRDAAEQAGIPCMPLEDDSSVSIPHPLARHWSESAIPIYASVVAADHIVNLCTPRTHALGDFTMAMKNNVGVVSGSWSRLRMHLPWGLKERLAEINLVVRPSLIVMDGREGFTDGGPDSGDLAHLGFIAAGSDPIAIDAIGLAHLRLDGANPAIGEGSVWAIPMMKRAVEIGLGVSSGEGIVLVGAGPESEAALRAQLV
jgi:uncharacterized protein (DUF362 family)